MPGVVFTARQSCAATTHIFLEVFQCLQELSESPKVIDKIVCHQYLYKYYGNRVVQHTLPEDKGIEVDVHIEIVEDGEDGDRVCGRDQGSKVEIVDEGNVLQVGDNTGT